MAIMKRTTQLKTTQTTPEFGQSLTFAATHFGEERSVEKFHTTPDEFLSL